MSDTIQISIDFSTASPINIDRLGGQNKALYNYLQTGESIHAMHPVRRNLKIGYLNSRISDLINKHKVQIYKRFIKAKDSDGEWVDVTEYSMKPFE